MPPSCSRTKVSAAHHVVVVDPLKSAAADVASIWRRISFGSPRDLRKPTATAVAVADSTSVRLGRVRLSGGAVGTVSEVHLHLTAVHLLPSSVPRALLVRVPRVVIRSLIALDKLALTAITANAERWFDDFELDYLEQYYRESTKQSDADGTVVPLARFALLPAEKPKKAGTAVQTPVPIAGQCVDIVLQLCGLNFQRRQVALAWKMVSIVAVVDVASRFAFVDDGEVPATDDDDVAIPEADVILQQDDPDAWYDDAGPGAEARAEMLNDLRSRITTERDMLQRRIRDIDDVTALTEDPLTHMRAMHAATERLGF